ncbi:hypothetical protein lerEdw1_013337 [Lerista edwardsae]|nr:hypothetical protein lerEdw1_013337 [Lerista edwardsae]
MATPATCTRFTDEYQLYEELGKYAARSLLASLFLLLRFAQPPAAGLLLHPDAAAAATPQLVAFLFSTPRPAHSRFQPVPRAHHDLLPPAAHRRTLPSPRSLHCYSCYSGSLSS